MDQSPDIKSLPNRFDEAPPAFMLRHDFPDIETLKRLIDFSLAQGIGWPSVVLNVKSREAYRPEVMGPLSLFSVWSGACYCQVGRHRVRVDEHHYFLTNYRQEYTLEIDKAKEAETFNVHFSDEMVPAVYRDLVTPDDKLLDDPVGNPEHLSFFNRLYPKTPAITAALKHLSQAYASKDILAGDEALRDLLVLLLQTHRQMQTQSASLSVVKRPTRAAIMKSVYRAVDSLRQAPEQVHNLTSLSRTAGMSEYHFLRSFRQLTKLTPHHYLNALRMQAALPRVLSGNEAMADIAATLGYADNAAFSRAFRRYFGVSPTKMDQELARNANSQPALLL